MKVIPLTVARRLNGRDGLMLLNRLDLPDYGPPGSHLTGPWAKTGKFKVEELDDAGRPRGGSGGSTILTPEDELDCATLDGGALQFTSQLGAGASDVRVRGPLPRPFRITHVNLWSQAALPSAANVQAHILIADDQDRTNGLSTSGAIMQVGAFTEPLEPFNVKQDYYPNYLVGERNKTIKIAAVNNSAGALETYIIVSFQFLAR